jgi:hypothetical protein
MPHLPARFAGIVLALAPCSPTAPGGTPESCRSARSWRRAGAPWRVCCGSPATRASAASSTSTACSAEPPGARGPARILLGRLVEAFVLAGPVALAIAAAIGRRRGKRVQAEGICRDPVRFVGRASRRAQRAAPARADAYGSRPRPVGRAVGSGAPDGCRRRAAREAEAGGPGAAGGAASPPRRRRPRSGAGTRAKGARPRAGLARGSAPPAPPCATGRPPWRHTAAVDAIPMARSSAPYQPGTRSARHGVPRAVRTSGRVGRRAPPWRGGVQPFPAVAVGQARSAPRRGAGG